MERVWGPGFKRRLVFVAAWLVVPAVIGVGVAVASGVLATRTKTTTVAPQSKTSVTAECPKHQVVLFGGFKSQRNAGSSFPVAVRGLRRSLNREWTVSATNLNSVSNDETAIAYCGHGPTTLTAHERTVSVPFNKQGSATATCPPGERVALGGFSATHEPPLSGSKAQIYLSGLRRNSPRSWTVSGTNENTDTGHLTAIAYCGNVALSTPHETTITVPVGEASKTVSASCPIGQSVVLGGYRADVTSFKGFVLIEQLRLTSSRTWTATGVNRTGSTPGHLTAIAYCH